MELEQLQLAPTAYLGAKELKEAFPWIVFTSGRRSLEEQARVMAINVARDRKFIINTYIHGQLLQQAVDKARSARTPKEFEKVLLERLLTLCDTDTMKLSAHLTGDAFDIKPIVDDRDLPTVEGWQVVEFIRRNLKEAKLLLKESGLVIWHCQFPRSVEV